MAKASLLFPAICLLFSFTFTICLYHRAIWYLLQKFHRCIRRLGHKARRKVSTRHPRSRQLSGSGGKQVGEAYDAVPSPDIENEVGSHRSDSVISTDDFSSWDSATTTSGSDVSSIWSVTESEEKSGGNIEHEQTQNHRSRSNGSPKYTASMESRGGFKELKRPSPQTIPSPTSALVTSSDMNTSAGNNYDVLRPPLQAPTLPQWEQELQRRIQEGRTPGAWLDQMADWAVRQFQAGVESDTAGPVAAA